MNKIILFVIIFSLFLIRFSFAQPTYSLNFTSNTIAGRSTIFSLNWTSASGYIFSFSNGTGTMKNDTFRNFGEINEQSADMSPMVALWHMNGDVSDASGNNNNGQMRGTLNCSISGKFGNACFFDNSSGNYINIGNRTSINFNASANFTWNAWINRVTSTDWDVIISKLNYNTSGLRFVVETNGTLGLFDSANNGSATPNGTISIGEWYMVTAIYTPNHQDIYVNGKNMSTSGKGTFVSNSITNLTIGFSNTDNEQFSGYIDEVAIWNRTLSSAEILKLYNNGYSTWSNITKVINSTVGANISWMIYANDSNNSWNTSSLFSFLTTKPPFPQWRNLGQNSSTIAPSGTIILSAQGYDTYSIDWAVLSTNESGSWQNQSWYSPLNLNNYTKWSSSDSNDTLDLSVVVDDINGDGMPEIITCGNYYNITEDKTYAQLRIWNYTATNSTSGSLNLKNELDWTNDTTFCYSVKVDDLNHDGHKKIITGGATGVNWNNADLRIFNYTNGQINLESIKNWYDVNVTSHTVIFTLTTADLNGDGKDEIITGGMFNETNYISQLRIWNYTNNVINFVAGTDWYVDGRTEIESVRVAKLNNDGQPKIITGGLSMGGPRYQAELNIWNFTDGTINLENRTEWYLTIDTIIYSVAVGDLNQDGKLELVIGGVANDGTRRRAQLRIWNYTQPTLNLENDYTWYVGENAAEVYSVLVQDINKDGTLEIVTAGMQNDLNDYGQVRIWTWMNNTLSLQRSNEWLDTGGVLEGELDDSLYVADLDGDGINEIVTGGRLESAPNYGILRVYSVGNVYGSPMNLTKIANTWLWSNFTWRNVSISSGAISWRIYYNNTYGNWNVTDIKTFSISDTTPPTWSANQSSTPTNYSLTPSKFNITWKDNVSISRVFITIRNSTGVLIKNASMSSSTYGSNIYNYSIVLPAGTFNWISYANDTSNNWNSTSLQYFTISKASNPVNLYLNNSVNQNNTYTYPQTVNATGTSLSGAVYLYRDNIQKAGGSSPQRENILLGNDTYAYMVNATGSQNYSDNTTGLTFYAIVNKGTLSLSITGDQTVIYPTQTTVNVTETNNGDSDVNYTLWRNDTLVNFSLSAGSISQTNLLNAGAYIYRFNASSGANWSANSTGATYYVIVNKATSYTNLAINETSVEKGNIINITSWPSNLDLSTTIYTNFTGTLNNITSATSGVNTNITDTSNLALGVYQVSANTTGNENYTDNTTLETKFITVIDTTAPKYSDNSTNSTQSGVPTEFRLKLTDNDQLSGYMFSLDNCTNSFYNFSWIPTTGQTNWSNFTTPINETIGCLIKWCFYFNDSTGNENSTLCSSPFNLTTTDGILPNITNVQAESITTSSATITWTTDENSNSSLVISPTPTYSDSESLTTSHSIELSGLSATTTYYYSVISCDASGNCANSTNQFSSASIGGVFITGSGGGGGGGVPAQTNQPRNKINETVSNQVQSCTEEWSCTDWSTCINGNQTRTCKDANNCGTVVNKPTESQTCTLGVEQKAAAIVQAPTGLFLSLTTNEWIIAIVIGVAIALVIILFSLKGKKNRKKITIISFVVALTIISFVALAIQSTQPKACTEEAKVCPDGSAVGRVLPNCDFAPCPTNITNSSVTINFGGYVWNVRTSDGLEDPGPNRWNNSADSVWIDTDGNLHMKIRKVGDKWYSSEVDMQKSLGYGRYVFMTESNVDKYDTNIVPAMFLYSFINDNSELDIEYGNWGGEAIDNALFTAQPVTSESQDSFNISSANGNYFSNIIDWNSNRVIFQVIGGHYIYPPSQDYVEHEWTYTGSHIPKTTDGQIAIINFWLYNGVAPSNGQDAELIISNFTFIPDGK